MRIAFVLLIILTFALPAQAQDDPYREVDLCLCSNTIARLLCKDPRNVDYVGKVQEGIYLFSVFYANRPTRFFCGVGNGVIRVQGKEFQKLTRTISFFEDGGGRCGNLEFTNTECPYYEPVQCCARKTLEEKLDEGFWSRSIPDLLDEDLRESLEDPDDQEQLPGAPRPQLDGLTTPERDDTSDGAQQTAPPNITIAPQVDTN